MADTAGEWSGRRVLVTGAGGFIGSHLVEALATQGAEVVAFTRYTSQAKRGLLEVLPQECLQRVRTVRGDLRDPEALEEAGQGVEYIFHLGALVGVPYSFVHPADVVSVNTVGTLNVLAMARARGVRRVVIASTSEVYGTALFVPITEEHPLQAQSPYAASKIGADAIANSFHRGYGLPVAIVRPFNAFGARQSDRAVIPTIISQALTQKRIKLGNVRATRDFTYVTDTVRGFLAAAAGGDEVLGQPINVGSGFEISVGELAERIISLSNSDAEVEIDRERLRPESGEVERLWCDNTKARELLGWEPIVPLDEGLRRAIDWVSRYTDLYKPGEYSI